MKKKILFIMPSLPGGGAEKVLIDILKNFDYSTYAVTLLLEFREGVYLNDVPGEVRVLSLHEQNTIWFERLHRVLRAVRGYAIFHAVVYRRMLLRLLKGERFDTIVSFMEGAALKFHSYITGKARRNLSWVHIDLKQKHWSLGFFRNAQDEFAAYQKMDEIVFVSKDAENHFSELYPLAEEKRTVIYNLIDRNTILSSSVSRPIAKTKFTICMVGRLNRQKRYDRALAVAKRLHGDGCDFELWILGEGNLESALKETVKAYGIEERVRFLGFKKPSVRSRGLPTGHLRGIVLGAGNCCHRHKRGKRDTGWLGVRAAYWRKRGRYIPRCETDDGRRDAPQPLPGESPATGCHVRRAGYNGTDI